MPKRIQRKRTSGWRMPDNAKSVTRPHKYGNPFVVGRDGSADECVMLFREAVINNDSRIKFTREDLKALRGKDLACFCALSDPCHADVLIEMANKELL
jgi:hypothetical protein